MMTTHVPYTALIGSESTRCFIHPLASSIDPATGPQNLEAGNWKAFCFSCKNVRKGNYYNHCSHHLHQYLWRRLVMFMLVLRRSPAIRLAISFTSGLSYYPQKQPQKNKQNYRAILSIYYSQRYSESLSLRSGSLSSGRPQKAPRMRPRQMEVSSMMLNLRRQLNKEVGQKRLLKKSNCMAWPKQQKQVLLLVSLSSFKVFAYFCSSCLISLTSLLSIALLKTVLYVPRVGMLAVIIFRAQSGKQP